MTTEINLNKIDTSHWLESDLVWLEARQAAWPHIEERLFKALFKSKRAVTILKQYYLNGKMPAWLKLKDWGSHERHLDIFCFLWLHPSWDRSVLSKLRDAYLSSDLTIEEDIRIGFGEFLRNGIAHACEPARENSIPHFIDLGGNNELLFEVLFDDLSITQHEIQGYTTGDLVVQYGLPKRYFEMPRAELSRIATMASWLCLEVLSEHNKDMLFQYDLPLEWWYQGCETDEGYFQKPRYKGTRPGLEKALYRIHKFDTNREGDTCRTRFVHKIRKLLNEREFMSEFKQMWEDVKNDKIVIKNAWEL